MKNAIINKYKAYAAAGVFVLLTIVKLVLPGQNQALRMKVLQFINQSDNYKEYVEMIQTLGSRVTESGIGERIVETFRRGKPQQTTLQEKTQLRNEAERNIISPQEQNVPAISEPSATQTPEPTPEPTPTTTPVPEITPEPASVMSEEPEAVSAFLAEQAEYDGYTIPSNVRTDMPEIPFEYTSPVTAYDSSGFGYRVHPIQGDIRFHYGTDYAANSGEKVAAFADGYVYAAGESDSYGKYLILTHAGGFASLYAHLSEFVAHEGDMVTCGQTIGRVGQTGNATGPHLHFELFLNDVYINPEYYV